jgi:very-short-patch-repair endonuclease
MLNINDAKQNKANKSHREINNNPQSLFLISRSRMRIIFSEAQTKRQKESRNEKAIWLSVRAYMLPKNNFLIQSRQMIISALRLSFSQ